MKPSFSKHSLINLLYLFLIITPFIILFNDFVNFSEINKLFSNHTFFILKNTIIQAGLSSVLALIIAILPAYYIANNNNLLSQLIESSIFIPFFFPPISTIIAFSIIFTIPFFKSLNISYSLTAILIVHAFYNSPIFVKYLGSSLRKIPKIIKEHAQIDGFSKTQIFFKIELPLVLPTLRRAFFLVFTYCFTSFAIVLALGNIRYSTFEVAIVRLLHSEFNFSKAFGYALIQFILLIIINFIISHKEKTNYQLESNQKTKSSSFKGIIAFGYIFFEYSIVAISIIASFYNFYIRKFDFTPLLKIISPEFNQKFPVLESITNSILLSFLVAVTSTILVFIILKNQNNFSKIIIYSTMGISSAFLGMGLFYLNILYEIPLFILAFWGHLLISIPIGFTFMYQHVIGFNQSILEAAKLEGASSLQIFKKIEFPLLRKTFLSTFLQLFAIIYGEFTIIYTMQINEYFPLASLVNYQLYSRRLIQEGAAFSSLNIILIISVFYIAKKIEK